MSRSGSFALLTGHSTETAKFDVFLSTGVGGVNYRVGSRGYKHKGVGVKSNKLFVSHLLVLLFLSAFASSLLAQSAGTGALTGTVTDPTGAVIPGVSVTAVNNETGLERTTLTREDGSYRFPLLPPGPYRVKFVNAGFKTSEIPSVTVNVTETPVLNRVLEVGGQSEIVEVAATAEVLQTATSTLGTTIDTRGVNSLPLTSRNYTQILGLSAGVSADLNNGAAFGKGTQNVSVNGGRPDQNNYQMDGVSIVNAAAGATSAVDSGIYTGIGVPNPDALQEFKIQTSTYDASYGRNPGANVNVVTKSGSNEFHGTLFEFFRNEKLNANDFFYNRNRLPTQPEKQVLKQNQFGGSFGGPLKREKLFFFGSYQGTRQRNGVAAQGTTNAFLYPIPAGDRSAPGFQAALGASLCPGNRPGNFSYLALLGPMQVACDGSNVNPVAMNILRVKNPDGSYYIPGATTGNIQNVLFSQPAKYTEDQYIVNGDWLMTPKHTVATRYFYTRNAQEQTVGNGQLPGWKNSPLYENTVASVKLTSVLTPTFINELRGSFHRNISKATDTLPYTPQQIGLKPMIPQQTLPPVMVIIGAFSIGGTLGPWNSPDNQMQVADQISWSKGRHTMRAGYEYERVQWNLVFAGLGRGFMFFTSFPDFLIGRRGCRPTDPTCSATNPGDTNGGPSGNILQCLFCVRSGPNGIIHAYRMTNMNTFFQDDWKVSPKLSLNLGVRWEYDGTLGDKYGNLTNIWPSDLATVPVPPTAPGNSRAAYVGYVVPKNHLDNYPAPPDGVRIHESNFPSRNGIPLSSFAPRIGFAWQVRPKLVLRGGAGIFYDRIGGDKFVHAVQEGKPYADTISFGPGANNPYSLQTPFLERPLAFAPRYFDPVTLASSSFNSPFYEQIHMPLTRQYNFSVQWEFANQLVLDLGYVGSSGINQANYNHNINTARLASPQAPVNGITVNSVANVTARVPYLGFQPNGLQGTEYNGVYKYDSLQATVRRQFSKGMSFQGAYTWSKGLSNISGVGAANSNNASDMRQQYGPTSFNRPHRFVANYTWDLPFGAGAGALRKLTEGWTLSGTTVAQKGTAMTITDTSAGTAYGTAGSDPSVGQSRAQLCAGVTRDQMGTSGNIQDRLGGASGGAGYINKAAFCDALVVPNAVGTPLPTEFGNSGVGILLGPGQFNWDIALLKTVRFEDQEIQFRTEFFNAFNTPQFANPGTQRNSAGTFGVITATSANPRIIQFALKYKF